MIQSIPGAHRAGRVRGRLGRRKRADWIGRRFRDLIGSEPRVVVRAPGRVNLLGAHVDYHHGWVLPGAVDRALWLAAAPATGDLCRWHTLDLGAEATVDFATLPSRPGDQSKGGSDWTDYLKGVLWALREQGLSPPAIDLVIGGDLPVGAGMSSSAALEVAFLLALRELGQLPIDREQIAVLGRRVENDFLGIASGIMDQQAILFGRRDALIELDCRDLAKRYLPLPDSCSILVADSGVRRRLSGSGYGDRVGESLAALELLQSRGFAIETLRDLDPGDLASAEELLPPPLALRVRHVVSECERVRSGGEALSRGELKLLGKLMQASHRSSRDCYQVSIPELDLLAEAAWASAGCYGARLSGGGFGGCVVALVERSRTEEVADSIRSAFRDRFGGTPQVFECRIAAGSEVIR